MSYVYSVDVNCIRCVVTLMLYHFPYLQFRDTAKDGCMYPTTILTSHVPYLHISNAEELEACAMDMRLRSSHLQPNRVPPAGLTPALHRKASNSTAVDTTLPTL